ncbi:retrovirus-related pol polyprotein from transposon TNT 1-94 [Tanacetum coccineum]
MWHSIEKGPYVRPMIPNADEPTEQILEPLSKMTEGNKKQYIAEVRVMNYHLQAIPNDIYNSVDVCKNAKDMWERIKGLMFGKEGESLESMYERLTTLVNIMDHNNLYDSLIQFKPHVQASKAKKASKNHDPLALLAHSNASSSQSHANPSYSPQPYYVTHPSSVADYEDEYQGKLQGDSQEDKLTTAMMLLARGINQKYGGNGNMNAGRQNKNQSFNAGTGNDESNQIVQHVPRTKSNPGKANVQCYNCNEKDHYAHDCQKLRVRDAKYFREQMLLAMKDEAGSNLKDEENDFMLDNSYGDETFRF